MLLEKHIIMRTQHDVGMTPSDVGYSLSCCAESRQFTGGETFRQLTQTDDIFISLSSPPLFAEHTPS